MLVLAIAATTSLVLGLLLAAASLARVGFRGYRWLFWSGLVVGVPLGLADPTWPIERAVAIVHVGNLWLQFLGIGFARGMIFAALFAIAIALLVGWLFRGRRAADFIGAGAGLGLGLGIATTVLLFTAEPVWLPSRIILALSNLPFQVCFGLFMAWAAMAPSNISSLLRHGLAVLLQVVYQAAMAAMREIGHWLAWIEPGLIALLWLGLIAFFWALALLVMRVQARSAGPAAEAYATHRATEEAPEELLKPRLWYLVAGLIMVPSLALLLGAVIAVEFEPGLVRMMLLVLLAVPLMAGAILWRTGLALRSKGGPLEARPARWRRPRSA